MFVLVQIELYYQFMLLYEIVSWELRTPDSESPIMALKQHSDTKFIYFTNATH